MNVGIVTSPPYAGLDPSATHAQGTSRKNPGSKNYRPVAERDWNERETGRQYGVTPGQIGAMNVITSPPFSQPETRDRTPVQAGSVGDTIKRAYTVDRQTMTEGNIARLSIVGSPPFMDSVATADPNFLTPGEQGKRTPSKSNAATYGHTQGQIGSMKGGAMTTAAPASIPTEQWYGCYDEGWGDLIVPDAYSHPAKMARGLAYRIIRTGLERKWWDKHSVITDPFGGIGTTGLVCAAHGLQAHLCELEQKFVDLARQNFELHRKQWEALGLPLPTITQGDSRHLTEVLTAAGHVVTSPPYAEGLGHAGQGNAIDAAKGLNARLAGNTYGATPGQISAMTSPPYGGTRFDGGPSETGQFGAGYRPTGNYSQDKANIGNSVMGSPPWEASEPTRDDSFRYKGEPLGSTGDHYGHTEGQMGQQRGETYWDACRDVYRECWNLMTPGAHMALVVKGYIKNKKYVDLPAQTLDLLLSLDFEPVLWVDSMLVAAESQPSMMPEQVDDYQRSRKSFFRRLTERKGSPRIDAEVVLCVRKPSE